MKLVQQEHRDAVILAPVEGTATATVVWLHGLGADGHDFVPLVPELKLARELAVRFVFPHAAARPVTINNGMRMRAWYDIGAIAPGTREDAEGIRASAQIVEDWIAREVEAGVPADRIVLAGFSQGAAMALHTGLRHPTKLAGIIALSGYLPLGRTLVEEASAAARSTPVLMCHGRHDPIVAFEYGELSRDLLRDAGYDITWREYPMQHQVCGQEIGDISQWLRARLTGGESTRA